MPTPLRIGFFGLPLGALLLAADGHAIDWAILSPLPQPGRRRLLRQLPHRRVLDLMGEPLPSLEVTAVGDNPAPSEEPQRFVGTSWQNQVSEWLATRPVDIIVSWFFTRRIQKEWIDSARHGAIGVHPSLLPKYRGPDPFYAVIDAGETVTGVTVHRLVAEYDKGAILMQRTLDVGSRNAWQLARALDRPSLAALRDVTRAFAEGRPPRAQDQKEELATYAPAPEGDGLKVDFRWPTERIMRRLRALCPVPGLALSLFGQSFLVTDARPTDEYPTALEPGEAYLGHTLILRTQDGAISVERAALDLHEDDEPETVRGEELTAHLLSMREKLTSE